MRNTDGGRQKDRVLKGVSSAEKELTVSKDVCVYQREKSLSVCVRVRVCVCAVEILHLGREALKKH